MRSILALAAVAALTLAACGSDSESSSGADTTAPAAETTDAPATTEAPETTEAPAPETTEAPATTAAPETTTTEAPATTVAETPAVTAADLAATGPYAVGVTTRALPEGNPVEVWYPATDAARGGVDAYRVRDFLPPAIADLIPADVNDSRSIDATRDAAVSTDGPFPVVLFSHGASSFRLQSSVLAQHLASWGMVVASTDHPSRDLLNQFGGTSEGQPPSVDDFRSMRTYLTTLDDDPIVGGALDNDRVALGGHSAGGGTVVQMAGDDGILGYVSYASGLGDEAPGVPSLFMAGELDAIVSPTERTVPAFERAPAPSWLWSFADSGHLAFSDLCAVGDGNATLIDLAEAAGLGAVIDDRLRTLGTDGCEDPNRPVEEVWPGIHQATTGFYRWVFGIDEAPIGLDASVVTDGVTVTEKLAAAE
ncbi:MAG: alpha/beta hydrolase family protein [Ilumatobacter sp.]|uniref:alpha/beta hydrolase family protein n=1 Tax=Ilumatobacter sp. TaxID=1967498 RepID=UPI0039188EC2